MTRLTEEARTTNRGLGGALLARLAPAVIGAVLACSSPAAADPYRLDRGDVLGVSVFGIPDFNRNVTVNVDGDIALPLLGAVRAAGQTLAELRERIHSQLSARDAMRNPEVTVELIEYRPFYISGDVTTSGAQPWRPGLTVRRAIAIAGGYNVMRMRNLDSPQAAAELSGRYHVLLAEYARRLARLRGFQAELEERTVIDFTGLDKIGVAPELLRQIQELETRNLADRRANIENEKRHLADVMKLGDGQIDALKQGQAQDQINVAQQVEALKRASSLQGRGLTNVARVSDEQRGLALIKSRELETLARLGRAREDRAEQGRKLERTSEDQRVYLTRAVQDASVDAEQTRSELEGIGQRLLLSGALGSQSSSLGRDAQATIYRAQPDGKQTSIAATLDTAVAPGDEIEVTVKLDALVPPPATKTQ